MSRSRRLVVALAINVALVAAQVVAGVAAHSTGLLSDAGHNLTDVAAVVLSLLAVRWSLQPRSATRTFGNYRATILAALVNAATLALVTGLIVYEAVRRLVDPVAVHGTIVVPVAAAAMVANAAAALVLRERGHDLNMRTTMVHMAADVVSSLVVLLAGVFIVALGPGWDRLDPAASLVVAVLIVVEAVRLLKQSADVLLESTPSDVDLGNLQHAITEVNGVDEVHDLHVWSLSTEYRVLSAHLVLTGHPTLEQAQEVSGRVRSVVEAPFDIAHTTFELECERCADEEIDPCGMDQAHSTPATGTQPQAGIDHPAGSGRTMPVRSERTRRSPE